MVNGDSKKFYGFAGESYWFRVPHVFMTNQTYLVYHTPGTVYTAEGFFGNDCSALVPVVGGQDFPDHWDSLPMDSDYPFCWVRYDLVSPSGSLIVEVS